MDKTFISELIGVDKTFIHELIEVKATNRIAKKLGPLSRPNDTMIEITPLREEDGTWTKFVPITELYLVGVVDDETKSN